MILGCVVESDADPPDVCFVRQNFASGEVWIDKFLNADCEAGASEVVRNARDGCVLAFCDCLEDEYKELEDLLVSCLSHWIPLGGLPV